LPTKYDSIIFMLSMLAETINECWNSISVSFAEPWELPFTVHSGERDDYEIYLMEKGAGTFTVGGREFSMKRGDVIFLRTNVENSFVTEGDNDFRFALVTFLIEGSNPCKDRLNQALTNEKAHVISPKAYDDARELLYEIQRAFLIRETHYDFEIKLLLGRLAALLAAPDIKLAENDSDSLRSRSAAKYVNQVVEFLQNNYSRTFSLEELGEYVGLHPRYLSSLYADYTGRTIWESLNLIRLERAKRMLVSTDLTITEIALDNGFNDAQYFSRRFSADAGISPRNYRNIHRNPEK